jgi:putative transposase
MSSQSGHRKKVKHYHRPGDLHELTFSCYQRRPLLTNDDWRIRLSRSIDRALSEANVQLVAFVYMPEHVHLLVDPIDEEPRLDLFLARLKQPYSKEIHELLVSNKSPLVERLTVRERDNKRCFRFWQEGPGYDRNLQSSSAVQAAIAYIHLNPVRRGLVQRAIDWRWSSACWYLGLPERQQDLSLPTIHGLRPGALDKNFAEF